LSDKRATRNPKTMWVLKSMNSIMLGDIKRFPSEFRKLFLVDLFSVLLRVYHAA